MKTIKLNSIPFVFRIPFLLFAASLMSKLFNIIIMLILLTSNYLQALELFFYCQIQFRSKIRTKNLFGWPIF